MKTKAFKRFANKIRRLNSLSRRPKRKSTKAGRAVNNSLMQKAKKELNKRRAMGLAR